MFEQYSYKTKLKFLVVLFCMLSIAAYRRSFSNLIEVIKENESLSKRNSQIENSSKNTKNIESELDALNKLIGKEGVKKEKIQQGIVAFILQNNPGVSINNMKPVHVFNDTNFNIHTYQVDMIGKFNQLIKTQYDFEKNFDDAKIVSTKWYTQNKDNKINTLHLTLIFQNYENN
jgi:hypothetical protein